MGTLGAARQVARSSILIMLDPFRFRQRFVRIHTRAYHADVPTDRAWRAHSEEVPLVHPFFSSEHLVGSKVVEREMKSHTDSHRNRGATQRAGRFDSETQLLGKARFFRDEVAEMITHLVSSRDRFKRPSAAWSCLRGRQRNCRRVQPEQIQHRDRDSIAGLEGSTKPLESILYGHKCIPWLRVSWDARTFVVSATMAPRR